MTAAGPNPPARRAGMAGCSARPRGEMGATRPSSPRLVPLLALAAGGVVANLYYCQPLLDHLAASLHIGAGHAMLVAGMTQLGYALGMLLLAPLGDLVSRRRIILGQFVLLVPALLLAAASPNLPVLLAAQLAVGFAATIVQQIIPLAASLAPPEATGRTIGTVMTGLTLGILLSRPVAGILDQLIGWRLVFLAAAAFTTGLGLLAWRVVPDTAPGGRTSYARLLASLPSLLATQPVLRRTATCGLLWSAAFNAFWAVLAFHLSEPPFNLGPGGIGLFGLAAAGGALASRPAGRLADRRGPRLVIVCGLAPMLLAFALMGLAGTSALAMLLGVLLLDAGVFAGQVGSQSTLLQLGGPAVSRINAVYMVCYCIGAAAGAALAGPAWTLGGWRLTCGGAFLACTASLTLQLLPSRAADRAGRAAGRGVAPPPVAAAFPAASARGSPPG